MSGRFGPGTRRLPPLVILGGDYNALSVARSVAPLDVEVVAINQVDSILRHSRCCRLLVPPGDGSGTSWAEFLLGSSAQPLAGAVLLAASDEAIETLVRHREALLERYILDDCNPEAQICMLNKLATYRSARAAGVPTPGFWQMESEADADAVRAELPFPLIIKPQIAHPFIAKFGKKYVIVDDFSELIATLRSLREQSMSVVAMERIEGPDTELCSYYTYMDADGSALFDFTKRIIRRFPKNKGLACYHITDHNPEVREVALRLFRHVGLRGVANAEFKRDQRDGQLKLIECNARFTAANKLVAHAGIDLGRFVYARLVDLPLPPTQRYKAHMRLWSPVEDFKAYKELKALGDITCWQWLRSVCHWQVFPIFSWRDPLPTLISELKRVGRVLARGVGLRRRAAKQRPSAVTDALS